MYAVITNRTINFCGDTLSHSERILLFTLEINKQVRSSSNKSIRVLLKYPSYPSPKPLLRSSWNNSCPTFRPFFTKHSHAVRRRPDSSAIRVRTSCTATHTAEPSRALSIFIIRSISFTSKECGLKIDEYDHFTRVWTSWTQIYKAVLAHETGSCLQPDNLASETSCFRSSSRNEGRKRYLPCTWTWKHRCTDLTHASASFYHVSVPQTQ